MVKAFGASGTYHTIITAPLPYADSGEFPTLFTDVIVAVTDAPMAKLKGAAIRVNVETVH